MFDSKIRSTNLLLVSLYEVFEKVKRYVRTLARSNETLLRIVAFLFELLDQAEFG